MPARALKFSLGLLEGRAVESLVSPAPVAGSCLFIASPVTRCGTTLMQRLLNSSANTLVFG